MAYRLAEAGLSVCVLERGKAYPPGSFPRSPWEMGAQLLGSERGPARALRRLVVPRARRHRRERARRRLAALVERRPAQGPLDVRQGRGRVLARRLRRPRAALRAARADAEGHAVSLRPRAVRPHLQDEGDGVRVRASSGSSGSCRRWPSRSTRATAGRAPASRSVGEENLHGRTRLTCLLCGECNIGCNYGAKNTLDFNYLSLAKLRHGADIRTRSEVKTFAPRDGGRLRRSTTSTTRDERAARRTLTADRLVLSAGAFGTTLPPAQEPRGLPAALRAARHAASAATATCSRWRSRRSENGEPRIVDPGYGPVITSTIRVKDEAEGGPGRALLHPGRRPPADRQLDHRDELPARRHPQGCSGSRCDSCGSGCGSTGGATSGARSPAFFSPADLSSSSMPLFSMGRDMPDGNMTLTDDGYLDVDWDKRARRRSSTTSGGLRGRSPARSTRSSWTTRRGT